MTWELTWLLANSLSCGDLPSSCNDRLIAVGTSSPT